MINNIVFGGNVAADPELRHFESGATLAKFTVYSTDYSRGKQEVTRLNVECWGNLAERAAMYCGTGKQVVITGKLREERWTDKQTGENRSRIVLKAEQLQLYGEKKLPINKEMEMTTDC